jgi:hypothetical protein
MAVAGSDGREVGKQRQVWVMKVSVAAELALRAVNPSLLSPVPDFRFEQRRSAKWLDGWRSLARARHAN